MFRPAQRFGRRELFCQIAASALPAAPRTPLVGIQIAPFSFYDEGIEKALDLIQQTSSANAVFVYTHTYYAADGLKRRRHVSILAPDHGVAPRDPSQRNLPLVWVRHRDESFRGTSVRHMHVDASREYAGRDLFQELVEPCRKRGIQIYGRVLEGSSPELASVIPGFSRVLGKDIDGNAAPACWFHPDYQAWWSGTVEDIFRQYELYGFQWGAERIGPLSHLLTTGSPPHCFCEHCLRRARDRGIDPQRARLGFRELHRLVGALAAGEGTESALMRFFRILYRYPEILAWDMQYRLGQEEMFQRVRNTIRSVRPGTPVGRHIDHQQTTYDLFHQAQVGYGEMAAYADFIKPILYHDVMPPRVQGRVEALRKNILKEFSQSEGVGFLERYRGHETGKMRGADYVYTEIRRAVGAIAGRTPLIAGIGIDIPHDNRPLPANPDEVAEVVRRAFAAGAAGILISREYDEMRLANLRAIGRALK